MESRSPDQLPLVVIAGPTASGKTALAIKLAKKYNGEIICADSRTIYRGMDIGTAKPTAEEQAEVPHWGIDLVEPGERFTAADFKSYAEAKIGEIRARGRIPFLVGGTGLYIDAILFDYQFGPNTDPSQRQMLEGLSLLELQEYCRKNSIVLPQNVQNKRYLIRAIEQKGVNLRRKSEPISNSIIVGISTGKPILDKRIALRTEQLFQNGVVEEAIKLGKKYGWESEAFTGNIYKIVRLYLSGELKEEEMKDKFTTLDRQLAKRQMTWLRRNRSIYWANLGDAEHYISGLLAK
ncbi:MAG TPA: tRNA (adenosine(37)-N6)-dimethylallyltransferase MiaA [Candidatus Saccharimonadales bacterium]|nr:tRNA (adenosine(37)-N6)-dimethylallyltransferase MiaA [Candidatus Saccharimonadales bacterium]